VSSLELLRCKSHYLKGAVGYVSPITGQPHTIHLDPLPRQDCTEHGVTRVGAGRLRSERCRLRQHETDRSTTRSGLQQ